MDFGSRIKEMRTQKGLKREELANKVDTSSAIIGRYERNERTPSIDIAKKLADALDVSLDYLTGNTSVLVKDKKMLYRLELLHKIPEEDQKTILRVVDSFLKEAQTNSIEEKLG